MIGLEVSDGAIRGRWEAMAERFGPESVALHRVVLRAHLLPPDETWMRVDGENWWFRGCTHLVRDGLPAGADLRPEGRACEVREGYDRTLEHEAGDPYDARATSDLRLDPVHGKGCYPPSCSGPGFPGRTTERRTRSAKGC